MTAAQSMMEPQQPQQHSSSQQDLPQEEPRAPPTRGPQLGQHVPQESDLNRFLRGSLSESRLPDAYGAIHAAPAGRLGFKTPSKRMNLLAIILSLLVPWLVFTVTHAAASFQLRFLYPMVCRLALGACGLLVLGAGLVALFVLCGSRSQRDPVWFGFLFITMLLAFSLGIVLGDLNYVTHTGPSYETGAMQAYHEVDPEMSRGQELMDAGTMHFKAGVRADASKAMGFRNSRMYCVAPLGLPAGGSGSSGQQEYDLWAVGVDCCNGAKGSFKCGPQDASGAVRLYREEQRGFYRLAVKQAEAAYGLRSPHPVFVTLTHDPTGHLLGLQDLGLKYFVYAVGGYFAAQLLLVAMFSIRAVILKNYESDPELSQSITL